jgi:Fe-S cluster assembly protein SufD
MTVALTRTKAEQALSRSFEAIAGKLPGNRTVAEARKAAIGAFAALGLPHRRIEQWKYTDLRSALKEALAPAAGAAPKPTAAEIDAALEELSALDAHRVVFVDGLYAPEPSRTVGAAGLEIGSLAALLTSGDRAAEGLFREGTPGQEAVIALNTAFMTDGAIVRLAAEARLDKPLLLVFARAGKEGRLVTTRNVVELGNRARATVIEAHVALGGSGPGQHAERRVAWRRRASRPRQVHAGRRDRKPPRDGAGDARQSCDVPRLPPDSLNRACAQQRVRRLQG